LKEVDLESSAQSIKINNDIKNDPNNKESLVIDLKNDDELSSISEDSEISLEKEN
jgi:hypothetical protein